MISDLLHCSVSLIDLSKGRYWHCWHGMHSRVYVMGQCLSVCPIRLLLRWVRQAGDKS